MHGGERERNKQMDADIPAQTQCRFLSSDDSMLKWTAYGLFHTACRHMKTTDRTSLLKLGLRWRIATEAALPGGLQAQGLLAIALRIGRRKILALGKGRCTAVRFRGKKELVDVVMEGPRYSAYTEPAGPQPEF